MVQKEDLLLAFYPCIHSEGKPYNNEDPSGTACTCLGCGEACSRPSSDSGVGSAVSPSDLCQRIEEASCKDGDEDIPSAAEEAHSPAVAAETAHCHPLGASFDESSSCRGSTC